MGQNRPCSFSQYFAPIFREIFFAQSFFAFRLYRYVGRCICVDKINFFQKIFGSIESTLMFYFKHYGKMKDSASLKQKKNIIMKQQVREIKPTSRKNVATAV